MKTKKMLSAHDPDSPQHPATGDFLVPVLDDANLTFLGLKSGNRIEYGRVVYTGKDISEEDVFARMAAITAQTIDRDATMSIITDYLSQIRQLRIGDIVIIDHDSNAPHGFVLKKTNLKIPTDKAKLP